jgi:hypothetical protein
MMRFFTMRADFAELPPGAQQRRRTGYAVFIGS